MLQNSSDLIHFFFPVTCKISKSLLISQDLSLLLFIVVMQTEGLELYLKT